MSADNPVELDPAQLAAEADAVDVPDETPPGAAGEAPPAAPGGEGGELTFDQAEALAASYEGAAFVLYDQAATIVAPNWQVTRDEKRALAHSTAVALALWFPDQQLPPKYVALLTLAGTFYAITDARRDPATGQLRPLRAPPPARPSSSTGGAGSGEDQDQAGPAPAAGAKVGGGFSTAA